MGGGKEPRPTKAKSVRKTIEKVVRKDLERVAVPGRPERSLMTARRDRTRTRLDASTESSLSYLRGLIDPINHGVGVRLPSDGIFPTSTASSFNRFVLPAATQTGGANSARTAGLLVYPDTQYQYCTLSTINIDNHSALVYGALQPGGAWSTVASNSLFYRGAVNMAVTFTCQSALLQRGGRLVATLLPPGAGIPTDVDSAFAYNRTVVLDIAKLGEQTTFFWIPATGEAGVAIAESAGGVVDGFYRTASMWTSPACNAPVNGDPVWAFWFQTNDSTAVSLDFTVQINNNFEFIPSFGGASQVFATKLVVGDESDAAHALKPLEAAMGPSVMEQIASGAMNAVKSVGSALMNIGSAASKGPFRSTFNMGYNLIHGDFAQAAYDGAGAAISALPFLLGEEGERQHRVAMSLQLPELSPLYKHRPGQSLRFFLPQVLAPAEFDVAVVTALRKRTSGPSLGRVREPDWEDDVKSAPPPSPALSKLPLQRNR